MNLTILGSGSPEAYIRRASSGYLVEVGTDCILFDCGGGVFDNLLRSGRQPSDITHIIFTHLHSDHMMDYARLIHAAWDEGGAPLKIYGPAPIRQITEGYFGTNGVLSHDLRARTELPQSQEVWVARGGTLPRPWPAPEIHEIRAGNRIEGNGWCIDSATAPHAQPFLECMAFALNCRGKNSFTLAIQVFVMKYQNSLKMQTCCYIGAIGFGAWQPASQWLKPRRLQQRLAKWPKTLKWGASC